MSLTAGLILQLGSLQAHPFHGPTPSSQPKKVVKEEATPTDIGEAPPEDDTPKELQVELSPTVQRLLDDEFISEARRNQLALFHGQWDQITNVGPAQMAAVALQKYQLDDPIWQNEEVPALLRAEAAFKRGQPREAAQLLADDDSPQAALLKARAWDQQGQFDLAIFELEPIREQLLDGSYENAADLTTAAQAVLLLAKLEGRPARDYHRAMQMLGRAHGELDALYWPARLAEARALMDKDHGQAAIGAIGEALELNPNASEAWYLLGRLTLEGFDFDRAQLCVARLRQLNPEHLLASLLETRMYLQQKDGRSALEASDIALDRYPTHRELIALNATARRLIDPQSFAGKEQTLLTRYEELSPNGADAYYLMGKYLSLTRQYTDAESVLREAIRRSPRWPTPRVELGLMLMQAGDDQEAKTELTAAAALDPFNVAAQNQLQLINEILEWPTIETEHFIIRFKEGIDRALAEDMPEVLEQIYADVAGTFDYKPTRKTLIEIMPDDAHFAVRITGMPDIWTIAACTGDVVAMTPPRDGKRQRGTYDWARVIRHEYTHTITLGKTANRLPHWFTEACAVAMEPGGRDFRTCQLLAQAHHKDELFSLSDINWAFVRPKRPYDRPLAYAQAHWMYEYITIHHGHDAILDLLNLYRQGVPDPDAIVQVTGETDAEFMRKFKAWAGEQVESWGLTITEQDLKLQQALKNMEAPTMDAVRELQQKFEGAALLKRMTAEALLANGQAEQARAAVLEYAEMVPVDPWVHEALLTLAHQSNDTDAAIAALEQLDRQEISSGVWSHQLAQLYRKQGELPQAADAIERALYREPYNASYRELAATVALQAGQVDNALRHLEGIALIEPDQWKHQARLAALLSKLGKTDAAHEAALKARAINPQAPVSGFLKPE